MIRNGRPYTCECRPHDGSLLSDKFYAVINKVGKWIISSLEPSESVLETDSYSLKHILHCETGVYLTNNEFKDAMLLAGYAPVDPDAPNWKFRASLLRDKIVNPSPFFSWAVQEYGDEDTPEGEFVRQVMETEDFPVFADNEIIMKYLAVNGRQYGRGEVFRKLWKKWEEAGKPSAGREDSAQAEPDTRNAAGTEGKETERSPYITKTIGIKNGFSIVEILDGRGQTYSYYLYRQGHPLVFAAGVETEDRLTEKSVRAMDDDGYFDRIMEEGFS